MGAYSERTTTDPYIGAVWQKTTDGSDYWVPADGCWDIIFARRAQAIRASISGPMTRARLVRRAAGTDLLGIRFKPGMYMPRLKPSAMVDRSVALRCDPARSSVWIESIQYEIPTYKTAGLFVNRLLKNRVLSRDPLIDGILEEQTTTLSLRSTQRHFAITVGLTRKFIRQIKRAQIAEALLKAQAKVPLCIVAARAGYADQAHMTRSFKLLLGRTPGQLVDSRRA